MTKRRAILGALLMTMSSWASSFMSEDGPVRIEYIDPVTNKQVAIKPVQTKLNIVVTGNVAQANLRQLFVNQTQDTIQSLAYVFPLPWKSSVHAMSYAYGGKTYVAQIFEKEEAKIKYDSIVQTGGQAALLLEDKPSIFKQQFANLTAGDSVWIDVIVSMAVVREMDQMSIVFPTMVADRYGSGGSTGNGYNPVDSLGANTLEINTLILSDRGLKDITSPTHDLDLYSEVHEDVRLVDKGLKPADVKIKHKHAWGTWLNHTQAQPNKDFVLRWKNNYEKVDFSFQSWKTSQNDTAYFMVDLTPDLNLEDVEKGPIELIVLMDISGSQSGWPLDYQKKIAYELIDKLGPGDRLQVISFSNSYHELWDSSKEYSGENIAQARSYIQNLNANGGTNLLGAIEASLAQEVYDVTRIYVFLTDGFITNEIQIFNALKASDQDLKLFTFGAGGSVNHYFLDEAATIGNGFSTVVTKGEDPTEMALEAWQTIKAPQLSDLKFQFKNTEAWSILKPESKTLFKGQNWQAYGKYTGTGRDTLTFTGKISGEPWSLSKEVTLYNHNIMSWSIPKLWAREKILELYLEQKNEENKEKIIETSLKYSVLSPYTAFLAYEGLVEDIDPYSLNNSSSTLNASTSLELESPIELKAPLFAQLSLHPESHSLEIRWNEGAHVTWAAIFDLQGNLVHLIDPQFLDQESYLWESGARQSKHYIVQIITTQGVSHQKVYF